MNLGFLFPLFPAMPLRKLITGLAWHVVTLLVFQEAAL